MGKPSYVWASLAALLHKDFVEELRARHAVGALLMFALVTLTVVSFAVGAFHPDAAIHAALLWITVFFSGMSGLGRSFIKEEEAKTAVLLRLAASPDTVFVGKLLFNTAVMVAVSTLIYILYLVLMGVGGNLTLLYLVLLLGTLGMACGTTLLAAVVAQAGNQAMLLPVLALPVLMPLLMVAVNASRIALEGGGAGDMWGLLAFLVSFPVVILAVSLLLFEYVWHN
ncbi:MAG TPA: heme exporter protein CcmB [Bacillota bacterium]|nr:heme exporter protein CcmB [Bacillota bacterium]